MSNLASRPILQPRSRKPPGNHIQSPPQQSAGFVRRVQSVPLRDRTMEEQQRVHFANTMREENELLVWTSLDRNESLPQTKLHYDRDMLFIDSDVDHDNGENDDCEDDSGGSGSGSIEWEETLDWDEEDHQRMTHGVKFGPSGWWDPSVHSSAEERLAAEKERKLKENTRGGKVKVKMEEATLPSQSPRNRRRSSGVTSSGSTPGRRRVSGGKRAIGIGSSSQE